MTADETSVDEYVRVADLRAAIRRFLRRTEKIARANALTPQRYLLLLMIKGAPGGAERSTVTELAERMQLAQSTVTELVGRAEEAGLVVRAPSGIDGRVAHLALTEEGERRLSLVFDGLEAERQHLLETLANFDRS